MTNKEAIAILTHNWKYRELIDNPYQYEALDLAIKALEERPQGENIPFTSLSCPSCGNSMWGYENGKIVCAVCGNTVADIRKEAENEHL